MYIFLYMLRLSGKKTDHFWAKANDKMIAFALTRTSCRDQNLKNL